MGYDYRGGGVEGDPHMAQAIKVLREGGSRRQRDRALLDKAMVAGAGTALTLGAGVLQAKGSNDLQENQAKHDQMAQAIQDQTAADRHNRETDKYYAPSAGRDASNAVSMDHAVMAGRAPVPGAGHVTDPTWLSPLPDIKAQASEAKDTQDMNAGASEAAIGGYRTPGASDTVDNESDVRAADVNTGRNLMRMGGMMNSLPRSR